MPATITIHDETSTGETLNTLTLDLLTERITVRDLIRSRVYQEVKDYNVAKKGRFCGLVQPTDAERVLNGYNLAKNREIDWRKQYDAALESFEANGFLLLVDDRQMESLDEEVVISPTTQVSFLKLVPLVGG